MASVTELDPLFVPLLETLYVPVIALPVRVLVVAELDESVVVTERVWFVCEPVPVELSVDDVLTVLAPVTPLPVSVDESVDVVVTVSIVVSD